MSFEFTFHNRFVEHYGLHPAQQPHPLDGRQIERTSRSLGRGTRRGLLRAGQPRVEQDLLHPGDDAIVLVTVSSPLPYLN